MTIGPISLGDGDDPLGEGPPGAPRPPGLVGLYQAVQGIMAAGPDLEAHEVAWQLTMIEMVGGKVSLETKERCG